MPYALASAAVSAVFVTGAAAVALGTVVYVVASIALSFALATVSKFLAGKPREATPRAQTITIKDPLAPRTMLVGEARTSGVIIFQGTSGTNNKYLWRVLALATHQCEEISDVWLEDEKIPTAAIDAATGRVTSGKYADNVYVWRMLGSSGQLALPELVAAFSEWDASHKGQGIAYAVVRHEFNQELYPNGPPQNHFFLMKGARFYDSAKDFTNGGQGSHRVNNPSTWEWTDSPPTIKAGYLTGSHMVYDVTTIDPNHRLGMNVDPTLIDWALAAAARNKSAELVGVPLGQTSTTQRRYVASGVLDCMGAHSENIARLNSADAGTTVHSGGLWRLFSGSYDVPSHSFTDKDLAGPIDISPSIGLGKVYNNVSPVYFAKLQNYQQTTAPALGSSVYETADGGRYPRQIDLPMTDDLFRAQRLGRIALEQSRNQLTLTLIFALNGFPVLMWETFNLSLRCGINGVFRCMEWKFNSGARGTVSIIGQVETMLPYVDPDSLTGYTNTGDISVVPSGANAPNDPTNLRTSPLNGGILIEWDPPPVQYQGMTYQVFVDTVREMTSKALLTETGATQYWWPRSDTTQFFFNVYAKHNGQLSHPSPPVNGVSGSPLAVDGSLTAKANPGALYRTVTGTSSATSGPTTAVVGGGTAPYTYAWAYLSGDATIQITAPASATTTFSCNNLLLNAPRTATFRCTVTDNLGATKQIDVGVTFTREKATA